MFRTLPKMFRRTSPRNLMSSGLVQQVAERYVMPPEWHKHSQTITVWPDFVSIGDADVLKQARSEVSAISNAISRFEPVTMFTQPNHVDAALQTISKDVAVRPLNANHLWVRDTGPIFVRGTHDGSSAGLKLRFNYWGSKISSDGDETVAADIIDAMATNVIGREGEATTAGSDISSQSQQTEKGITPVDTGFTSEGGAIEVDGLGTLLATESSIINSNRNPLMPKAELEKKFQEYFGISKTIWLLGLKGYDSTDYHIDAFARFIKPGQILLSRPSKNAERCVILAYEEAKDVLANEKDSQGSRLEVVEVEEPHPRDLAGEPLGVTDASYANYYLTNGGLIMPRFGVRKVDDEAYELFHKYFPNREIVQVDLNALPRLGGGIHCATQQVPAM